MNQGHLSRLRPASRIRIRTNAFLSFGKPKTDTIMQQKSQLLAAIKPLNRGAGASAEVQQDVEALVVALEKRNPTKKPLASDLLNGKWELLYTTSASILGSTRPPFLRPAGPIYQLLGAFTAGHPKSSGSWLCPASPSTTSISCIRTCRALMAPLPSGTTPRGAFLVKFLEAVGYLQPVGPAVPNHKILPVSTSETHQS